MKQEKTALEWFDMLIEPYCSQAKENAKELDVYENLHSALSNEFTWELTPPSTQGDRYWRTAYESILNGELHLIKPEFNHTFSPEPTQPQFGTWISVDDRLPDVNQSVIIYDGNSETPSVKDFFYYDNLGRFRSFGRQEANNFVTFWMPLPPNPTK